MDPEPPAPSQGDGAFLADAPAAAVDALVSLAGPDADTSLASVEIRHLGGALARPAPGGGALPSIDAKYLAVFVPLRCRWHRGPVAAAIIIAGRHRMTRLQPRAGVRRDEGSSRDGAAPRGARLRSVRCSGQGRMVRAVMRPSAANWKWNLRLTGLPGKSPAMSTAASWPVVVALTSWTV